MKCKQCYAGLLLHPMSSIRFRINGACLHLLWQRTLQHFPGTTKISFPFLCFDLGQKLQLQLILLWNTSIGYLDINIMLLLPFPQHLRVQQLIE